MSTLTASRNGIQRTLLWAAIVVLGAVSLGDAIFQRQLEFGAFDWRAFSLRTFKQLCRSR
jgi:hypothetical protein